MISQSDTNSNNSTNKRSTSESGHGRPSASVAIDIPDVPRLKINGLSGTPTRTHIRIDVGSPGVEPWAMGKRDMPPSPKRPIPSVPLKPSKASMGIVGKDISSPVLNRSELGCGFVYWIVSDITGYIGYLVPEATVTMSPVQNRAIGLPIPIQARPKPVRKATATLASGYVHNSGHPSLTAGNSYSHYYLRVLPGQHIRFCHMIWRRTFSSFQSRNTQDSTSPPIGLGLSSDAPSLLLR